MGKKLYVGNLPYTVTDDSLQQLFTQFGEILSAQVIKDRASGRSKGFGFVEMAGNEEADKAIAALNGSQMEGRALTVNEARPQAPREGGDRGGRGGYGGGGGDRGRGGRGGGGGGYGGGGGDRGGRGDRGNNW